MVEEVPSRMEELFRPDQKVQTDPQGLHAHQVHPQGQRKNDRPGRLQKSLPAEQKAEKRK